jgi:hypothetical protein
MPTRKNVLLTTIISSLLLSACGGSTGENQSASVSTVAADQSAVPQGGLVETKASAAGAPGKADDEKHSKERSFQRIASFEVCSQIGSSCASDEQTSAEIVAVGDDGRTLIYSNSPGKTIGFVDITNPAHPVATGGLAMGGEPTSIAVRQSHALVAVNTSPSRTTPTGHLAVVDVRGQEVKTTLPLPGQPDSIAVSKDGRYIAVVVENERDEEVNDGELPQLPGGSLVVVDAVGEPVNWRMRTVDLSNLMGARFANDPEPEYVSINEDNVAVLTLQENNHIVLVDLASGMVIDHFTAGTVDLQGIDSSDDRPASISLTESSLNIPREPDGVAWLPGDRFATADEGDLDGGGRGFTVFNVDGSIAYASGNLLEREAVRLGHYPDRRSDAKGNEPENVAFARYGSANYLFVASERSSLVFVFDMADPAKPRLKQALPAGVGPEGILPIPSRNLLVAASEEDARELVIRSVISIYSYEKGAPTYPTVLSADRADGMPIPWGALSGLAADPGDPHRVFAIDDSFYRSNRIFGIDVKRSPAVLTTELQIRDLNGVLARLPVADAASVNRSEVFDSLDLAAMINPDKTVNLDPEGIAVAAGGGFWIASEGGGTVGEAEQRPITSSNLVLKVSTEGVVERVITLPDALNGKQQRFGFEGIAESNGELVVAFQRAWGGEAHPRLGIYNLASGTWRFVFYPLDPVESPNGGWVGLSDIAALRTGQFLVVERDNQGGPDARIKRLYQIDLAGAVEGMVVSKTLVRDLLPDLRAPGGIVPEKIEGLAVLRSGQILVVNDNDGVNDNSGETQLLRIRHH